MPKSKPSEVEIVAMLLVSSASIDDEFLMPHDCVADWENSTPTRRLDAIDAAERFILALRGKP